MPAVSPGTRLGPYEITARLGAGGMGEVYKAVDTRLGRSVAVKILVAPLVQDATIRERFQREARTLGSLRHPHICPIHDLGSVGDTDYLVMEFLDGETLAERLQAGRVPLDKALAIAIDVADALDAAHRAGIVHRDLKPGNIMLTSSGAMLLDFGIATARAAMAIEGGASAMPTTVSKLTADGLVLGTFPYMAPEQIEGREADARSDIFAFGAVLFEMVTGRRAFGGETHASVIGAILRDVPPPIAPALDAYDERTVGRDGLHNLEHAIQRCLAKDPNDRWQNARDLALQLRWIADGQAQSRPAEPVGARRYGREAAAWIVAGAAVVAALGMGWASFQRTTPIAPVVRFAIDVPPHTVFAPTSWVSAPHPVISPDGRQVAFLAQSGTDPVMVWLRALDTLEGHPLAGTEGALFPFWSPDGRRLGFFAGGALKTIDPLGGAAHRVCDAPAPEGGTWNRDGTILFTPRPADGLYRVPAAGGVPVSVMTPSPSRGSAPQRWPSFLPDGRHFVFHEGDSVSLGSLDSPEVRVLTKSDSQAVYSRAGYLLFVRGTTLMAQPFDARRGALSGEPQPIADGVSRALTNAAFSVSESGVLIYRSGRLINRQLTWFDRSGQRISSVGDVHDFNGVHLSPDGKTVAYHRHDGRPDGDVWLVDLARGTSERFTHTAENLSPVWSPDSTRIAYASNRDSGVNNVWVKGASGSASDVLLLTSTADKTPRSWSPNGMFLAYVTTGARGDIWIVPLAGGRTPFPFAQTEFDERDPAFSPDGKWLAYHSDESGRNEVYVRPFPKGEGRYVISTGGGTTPIWRGDGGELFYQVNREIWAVAITSTGAALNIGRPQRLMDIGAGSAGWDVAGDGQRFLVGRGVEERAAGALTVTVNWPETLRK